MKINFLPLMLASIGANAYATVSKPGAALNTSELIINSIAKCFILAVVIAAIIIAVNIFFRHKTFKELDLARISIISAISTVVLVQVLLGFFSLAFSVPFYQTAQFFAAIPLAVLFAVLGILAIFLVLGLIAFLISG